MMTTTKNGMQAWASPVDALLTSTSTIWPGRYVIDWFQRGYCWQTRQAHELVDDLYRAFNANWQPHHTQSDVSEYGEYFLGPITTAAILNDDKQPALSLIDGQQRLTSLSLMFIALRDLQYKAGQAPVETLHLLRSEKFGTPYFTLNDATEKLHDTALNSRRAIMESLLAQSDPEQHTYDQADLVTSAATILARYRDLHIRLKTILPTEAFSCFVDWLRYKVILVEIRAPDATTGHTAFETMNDRGLSLTSEQLLKSHLLANVPLHARLSLAATWEKRVQALNHLSTTGSKNNGNGVENFFRAWLRARMAMRPVDWEMIGNRFHRFVALETTACGLTSPASFVRFVDRDFGFYSSLYLQLQAAATRPVHQSPAWLHYVRYNHTNELSLQTMFIMASLQPTDAQPVIERKVLLTSRFLDILWAQCRWNTHRATEKALWRPLFKLATEIRHLNSDQLAQHLYNFLETDQSLKKSPITERAPRLDDYKQTMIRHFLARISAHVAQGCELKTDFDMFWKYEIEHVWANHPERHMDECPDEESFNDWRNRIGALLLLPKSFNASYSDKPYNDKRSQYCKHATTNPLAAALDPEFSSHNPGYHKYCKRYGLVEEDFGPVLEFTTATITARNALYAKIANLIWNPAVLLSAQS